MTRKRNYTESKTKRRYIMDTKVEKGKFKVLLSKNKPKQRVHQNGEVTYPRATPLANYKNINDLYIQKLLKSNQI